MGKVSYDCLPRGHTQLPHGRVAGISTYVQMVHVLNSSGSFTLITTVIFVISVSLSVFSLSLSPRNSGSKHGLAFKSLWAGLWAQ